MSSQEIKEYYDATEHREVRSDLTFAVNIVDDPKIAIDCGCGAGADIEYLLAAGFKVYGFDIEDESISRCKKRFKNNKDVILSKAGFSSYKHPRASLIVADASLFFAQRQNLTMFGAIYTNVFTQMEFFVVTDEIKEHRKSLQSKESDYFVNIDLSIEKDKDKIFKAVQRIGIMVYIGAIPLSYVLIMNGFQVVTDWMHVARFVDKVRGSDWLDEGQGAIPYARRHAEWLSLVCFMYLKNSKYSVNSDTLNGIEEFEKHYGGYKNILSAERKLRQVDIQFAGGVNMREVDSIRFKYRWNEIFKSNKAN